MPRIKQMCPFCKMISWCQDGYVQINCKHCRAIILSEKEENIRFIFEQGKNETIIREV